MTNFAHGRFAKSKNELGLKFNMLGAGFLGDESYSSLCFLRVA